ncbi:MAG: aminoacyl-histidine dipeptidase [Candidatus Thermoplasmatota archaeon]|nr:aminoacyl-histidine dipeptidase [Candidatus Thermoplasmatota archaeon]
MSNIENLEPKLVWRHFDRISKLPRCSKHEENIRKYIVDFGKKQGLKTKVDAVGNVFIFKPAASGMQNKPTVILQSHMDMVCEKNSDVEFDFSKDPLQLRIQGDVLTAVGTTLGADDGIGLAVSLAILEDKKLQHGPIESLYTVDEEIGFTGVFGIKSNMLSGKTMLNLDNETFGALTVGCAGGGDSIIKLPLKMQPINRGQENIVISVSGLRGGHSGVDISEQRGNAIKILARLLWKASLKHEFSLCEIKGGDKLNAIPRQAYASLAIKKKNKNAFVSELNAEEKDIYNEIKPIDPNFKVDVEPCESLKMALNTTSQTKLLNLLYGLPHGVHQMDYNIKTLANTSTNLATVSVKENTIVIGMSSRSSMKSALQDMQNRIKAVSSLSGARVTEENSYPGWKPNLQSKILALSKKIFKDMFKAEPKIEVIHGGLECGVIWEKFPGIDMLSIGPTIKNMHSPEEQVQISTVDKLYKYLQKILESV